MHQMNMWYIRLKQRSVSWSLQSCVDLESLAPRAHVLEMQTRAGYGGVAVLLTAHSSENTSPLDRLFRLKAPPAHQPIECPGLVHSRSSTAFMSSNVIIFIIIIVVLDFSQSVVSVYALKSHTQHDAVLESCGTHSQTALQHFTAYSPIRVLDMSSMLHYMLHLFTHRSSCFHSRPQSTIVFLLLHQSWRPSNCTFKGNLHIYVAAYHVLCKRRLWGIHK